MEMVKIDMELRIMRNLYLKFNSVVKVILFLFAVWFLFTNVSQVYALDEYSPDTERLSIAGKLKLTAGKSSILECDEEVTKVAVGQERIADVRAISTREILINPLRAGTTNLILWHEDGTTSVYDLLVKYDISEITKKVKEMAPGTDITVSTSFGMLMVDGSVNSQETMDRVLKILQAFVPREGIKNLIRLKCPRQVQLEAKIAVVSRSDIKRFGLNFLLNQSINGHQVGMGMLRPEGGGNRGSFSSQGGSSMDLKGKPGSAGSITHYTDGSVTTTLATPAAFDMTSTMTLASPFVSAFQLAFHVLDQDIAGMLSLLKSQGLARIIARPSLVTMSGQKASLLVGGDFPVPVTGSYGSTGFHDKEYGIKLEFVPTVTGKETIDLQIKTRCSDIDYSTAVMSGGAMVPGVITREASSRVQLKDGQSFAIAGLLKDDINLVVNKVPLLGDIPILGALFRHKEYAKKETELIILVTAKLVKPMNKQEIPPLPGESRNYSQGDFEFFFLDNISGKEKPDAEKRLHFSGPVGFEK